MKVDCLECSLAAFSCCNGMASTSTSTPPSLFCNDSSCATPTTECDLGSACPSASFVGWDHVLGNDCEQCERDGGRGAIDNDERNGDDGDSDSDEGRGKRMNIRTRREASVALGESCPDDTCCYAQLYALPCSNTHCTYCRNDDGSVTPERECESASVGLSGSGSESSVATPVAGDDLMTAAHAHVPAIVDVDVPALALDDIFEGLDEKTIGEILACCCCGSELQNPSWTPAAHTSHLHPPNPALPTFTCKWSGCSLSFTSKEQLGHHVNVDHLALAPPTPSQTPLSNGGSPAFELTLPPHTPLLPAPQCQWDHCTGMSLPPSSMQTGDQDKQETTSALIDHLLLEHLAKLEPSLPGTVASSGGTSTSHSHTHTHTHTHTHDHGHGHGHDHDHSHGHPSFHPLAPLPRNESKFAPQSEFDYHHHHGNAPRIDSLGHSHSHSHSHSHGHGLGHVHRHTHGSATGRSRSHGHPYGVHKRVVLRPSEQPSGEGVHVCKWRNCGLVFPTSQDLMEHLGLDHVGSGKASYSCEWDGCERRDEHGRGFVQRQKIMRHLQTHTGDRPFVCEVCQKSFSEATTLTQHMRVHTNEKPFSCTYDGCGKSFALASALTIHLRTHTGDKPFVCPYEGCKAAFAESSNLSKHVRTHKGERKYVCDECGASFCRSDQRARHAKIHVRKRVTTVSSGSECGQEIH